MPEVSGRPDKVRRFAIRSVAEIVPDPSKYPYAENVVGWHHDSPVFERIVKGARADGCLVVEVGVFTGGSTTKLAELCQDAIIASIDTFCGSEEHMGFDSVSSLWGRPIIWEQFLANICRKPYASRVYPIMQTSISAARLLQSMTIKPWLIYIDASHEPGDVYNDMVAYWRLLPSGGTMFGDDFTDGWKGVVMDVNRFCYDERVNAEVAGPFWVIKKP